MATKEQIDLKYDTKINQLDDQILKLKGQIDRLQTEKDRISSQKAAELKRIKPVEEEAQGAITTTSVGNAAEQGGDANFAPSIGVVSRVGYYPPKKQAKKKKKKTYREFIENMFNKE